MQADKVPLLEGLKDLQDAGGPRVLRTRRGYLLALYVWSGRIETLAQLVGAFRNSWTPQLPSSLLADAQAASSVDLGRGGEDTSETGLPLSIVGIGASAGGLEAVTHCCERCRSIQARLRPSSASRPRSRE